MTTIFVSGSRAISRLSEKVTARLQNIINLGHDVITGDANGVDKAVQSYLFYNAYEDVTIYHVGDHARNNIGNWRSVSVDVAGRLRGRELFTQKDKRMAEIADSGMIIWDGKSPGSVQNMIWMLNNFKASLVYQAPAKSFVKVKTVDDLRNLIDSIDDDIRDEIDKKININSFLAMGLEQNLQGTLSF